MTNTDLIVSAIDWVETHLCEEFTVAELAAKIGYSFFHFSRLFHGITGHTPQDFILRRRISEAAKQIMNTKRKIIDIAFDFPFGSHEAFSRAFKKTLGVTPSELRKRRDDHLFLPFLNRLSPEYMHTLSRIIDYQPETVELPAFPLVGFVFYVETDFTLITKMWYQFHPLIKTIPDRVVPEKYYQLAFWNDIETMPGCFYMVGVETSGLDKIPVGMSGKVVPASNYLRFVHRGLAKHVGRTYKYIFQTWLPRSEYRLSQPYEFEYYGPKCLGPDNEDSESEIYIPVGE
ncbi:MAG: hypothetical protein A2Y33_12445 [Spirochaetes bacterium GWF1_51_8]|nr:MAG: hypothetical protein A2Y33_12445 [Spirochaetes bacterium GWF1_51_8]